MKAFIRPLCFLSLFLALPLTILAEEEAALPERAQELLGKLQEFKITQMEETRRKIDEAEEAALAILKNHFDEEIERGNVDTSVALQKIENLSEDGKPDPALPVASKEVIEKFQAYAKGLTARMNERVAEMEEAVARILERQMKELTRKKDLQGALAIRSKLEEMSSAESDSRSGEGPESPRPRPFSSSGPTTKLDKIMQESGSVTVAGMQPVPFEPAVGKEKKGWSEVPDELQKNGALVFWPTGPNHGEADFEVTESGYFLLACNFDYQGNSSGGWTETRWTKKEFEENGWRELSEDVLGGRLTKFNGRKQVVFYKELEKGESGSLRCNKYGPPYFIVFPN